MKISKLEKLNRYKTLIAKYHKSLDLVSDVALASLDRLVEVALSYSQVIEGQATIETVLDVGSGVGLPGIVIAITLPEHHIMLVERRKRRSAFLQIVVSQLGLRNVTLHRGDVQQLKGQPAPLITAQAVASFTDLYCLTRHIHAKEVILLSKKGEGYITELEQLSQVVDVQLTPVTRETDGIIVCEKLHAHGTLVGVRVPGGRVCPPSVLLTKKAV